MMATFGPQIQASLRQQNAQAAGGGGNNGNGPSPTIPPSAPPTSASQSRPPAANNNNAQAPAAATDPANRFKQLLSTLQAMTDQQRNAAIAAQPNLGNLWSSYLQQRGGKPGGANVRPPQNGNNVRPPLNGNSPAPALNLTLPPGRVRPPGPQNGAGIANNGAGRGSPAMGLQQQQQQQRLAQGNRVGSPANATPQQQQQLQQIQQQQAQNILLQQQGGVSPAGTGPIPISRPQASSAAHLASLPSTSPAPHPNPGGPRPTLSGGLAAGPVVGTPSLLQRQGTGWEEATRAGGAGNQGAAGDMRKRKIREVVDSVEKGEKLEEGVEDLLLELVDELIDSSTQFAARLAKHRKSNTLDVRDLQLHLERNHNIRVPGSFADEIKQGQSQTARRTPVLNQHAQRVMAVHAAKAAAAAKGN
ncbi:transcription initiation factor TFIID subunit A-domain-containing protein [Mrakia frigida]|uniref:transcription initiation factor TFIID subunit 12 n=1 Tax=Mrakia frigida TaxID=29902 RepID=UPI003FCC1E42